MQPERRGIVDWLSERLNLTEIFSLLTSYGLFNAELDSRKPLREALAEAFDRPMISYARWPRVLGLIVVTLLAMEFVTGGLLALYYLPTTESAHASVTVISRDIHFGWFVHQSHIWGARLLIAILIVRLVRFFVQAVYRRPRELVWLFAALLLIVCLHIDLTGRVLPLAGDAYWSAVRALEVMRGVPVFGTAILFFIAADGTFITDLTLIRAYVFHVAWLPLLALALIYLHFSTVRRVGLSGAGDDAAEPGRTALRRQLANLAMILVLLFGLLASLAVLAPSPLLAEADPFKTLPGIGPPWYLLAPFGFLEWSSGLLPRWAARFLLFVGFTAFVFLPFLDRSAREPRRRLTWALALLGLALWITFTIYGMGVA